MEAKLLENAIQGDVDSFEKLIKTYNRYVYNIAYRMMGNEEDAKDMSQEALIKAYRNIGNFKMESSFSTWLYRIVINACKDELRKRKEATYSLDETYDGNDNLKYEISDQESDPILVYEKVELKANIESALNQLSDDGKSVVVLKDILGYSYDEIGEILQIPIGTVRSRLNRSRLALKKILQLQLAES